MGCKHGKCQVNSHGTGPSLKQGYDLPLPKSAGALQHVSLEEQEPVQRPWTDIMTHGHDFLLIGFLNVFLLAKSALMVHPYHHELCNIIFIILSNLWVKVSWLQLCFHWPLNLLHSCYLHSKCSNINSQWNEFLVYTTSKSKWKLAQQVSRRHQAAGVIPHRLKRLPLVRSTIHVEVLELQFWLCFQFQLPVSVCTQTVVMVHLPRSLGPTWENCIARTAPDFNWAKVFSLALGASRTSRYLPVCLYFHFFVFLPFK